MNWYQKIYDKSGNILFDPTIYGENIRIENSNGKIRYYDENNNLLFTTDESNVLINSNHNTYTNNFIRKNVNDNSKQSIENNKSPVDNNYKQNVGGIKNTTITHNQVAELLSTKSGKNYTETDTGFQSDNNAWTVLTQNETQSNNTHYILFDHMTQTPAEKNIPKSLSNALDGTDTVCVGIQNWRSDYIVDTMDELGVSSENIVFAGASKGCTYTMNKAADYIMNHPGESAPSILLIEGNPVCKDSSSKDYFSPERADAIRKSDAEIFVVGHTGRDGGFYRNTGVVYGGEEDADSNVRVYSIGLNYKPPLSPAHAQAMSDGESEKLGLVGLLTGNDQDFLNMMEEYKANDGYIYYSYDANDNPLKGYKPEITLRYKGQEIELTLEQFYDYHSALITYKESTNLTTKIDSLSYIYSVEGKISNVPSVVSEYMAKLKTTLNKLDTAVTMQGFNDVLGLGSTIYDTVRAYNECMESLKSSLNKCADMGTQVSASYESLDTALAESAPGEV